MEMTISEEERIHLVSELKKLSGEKPMFYLKFCREKKFAEDVCNGLLYSNTPIYFREQEMQSGEAI